MTTLPITPEQLETLDLSARYLRTLSAVQRAYMLDDREDMEAILASVDPVELRMTETTLTAISRLWQLLLEVRGGTDGRAPARSLRQVEQASPDMATADGGPSTEQPTAPIFRCNPDESAGLAEIHGSKNWRIDCA